MKKVLEIFKLLLTRICGRRKVIYETVPHYVDISIIPSTPILFGEDARRFEREITNAKPSETEKRKCRKAYEHFKKIADFPM